VSPVDLRELVREIPDFPAAGILFKDITPLLLDSAALDAAISDLAAFAGPLGVDIVIAAEARGFILGGALARELGAGFVPARKRGKLPSETVGVEYVLEYGIDVLEVHADAFGNGVRVLVHDDLLATGGTARGVCDLVTGLGAEVVGCAFLVELSFLGGRARLDPFPVHAALEYSS